MARLALLVAGWYRTLAGYLNLLQPVFLLTIRLYIGWELFKGGRGKLMNIAATADSFRGFHIPMPELNAYLSGTIEAVCGIALMLGLATRLFAIPMIVNMMVAYATAHPAELKAIVADTNRFLKAPPFLFLLTAIIMLAFGPGAISIDGLFNHLFRPKPQDDRSG